MISKMLFVLLFSVLCLTEAIPLRVLENSPPTTTKKHEFKSRTPTTPMPKELLINLTDNSPKKEDSEANKTELIDAFDPSKINETLFPEVHIILVPRFDNLNNFNNTRRFGGNMIPNKETLQDLLYPVDLNEIESYYNSLNKSILDRIDHTNDLNLTDSPNDMKGPKNIDELTDDYTDGSQMQQILLNIMHFYRDNVFNDPGLGSKTRRSLNDVSGKSVNTFGSNFLKSNINDKALPKFEIGKLIETPPETTNISANKKEVDDKHLADTKYVNDIKNLTKSITQQLSNDTEPEYDYYDLNVLPLILAEMIQNRSKIFNETQKPDEPLRLEKKDEDNAKEHPTVTSSVNKQETVEDKTHGDDISISKSDKKKQKNGDQAVAVEDMPEWLKSNPKYKYMMKQSGLTQ